MGRPLTPSRGRTSTCSAGWLGASWKRSGGSGRRGETQKKKKTNTPPRGGGGGGGRRLGGGAGEFPGPSGGAAPEADPAPADSVSRSGREAAGLARHLQAQGHP